MRHSLPMVNEAGVQDMCLEAVYYQKYKLVKILLEGGCSPDICDSRGRTLLMICFETAGVKKNGWESTGYKIVNILLHFNADINLEDSRGWTCLMYAYYYGAPMHVMGILLNAGIIRKDIDDKGNTFSDFFSQRWDFGVTERRQKTPSPKRATPLIEKKSIPHQQQENFQQPQQRQRCYSDASDTMYRKKSKKVSFSSVEVCNSFDDPRKWNSSSVLTSERLPEIKRNSSVKKSEKITLPEKESYWVKVRTEFLIKKREKRQIFHKFECNGMVYTCTETITPAPASPSKRQLDMTSLERLLSL